MHVRNRENMLFSLLFFLNTQLMSFLTSWLWGDAVREVSWSIKTAVTRLRFGVGQSIVDHFYLFSYKNHTRKNIPSINSNAKHVQHCT